MQVQYVEEMKTICKRECVVEMVKKTVVRTKRVKVPVDPCTGASLTAPVA